MSLSDRRQFLSLMAALPLMGCGFSPEFAPGAPATALKGQVLADVPADRLGFLFVSRIEERLGPPEAPAFLLSFQISTQRVDLAVTTEGSILRYNIVGQVAYTVRDARTGAVLTKGTAQSFTASAATQATIAAQSAEDDANKRLMLILGDQVVTRLIATAADWVPAAALGPG
jgi:LPS-assembly lipoprotein